jgi:putative membrane protein
MRKHLTVTGLICTFALVVTVMAQAGQPPEKPATTKTQANPDATFMLDAAMANMAEVEHGRTAAANAQNDEVKKFGQRMVDDHSKTLEELKALASQKQVTLPTMLDQKHRAMQEKLEKAKGHEFDHLYMQQMVTAHKGAVTLFQHEATNGKDADVRAWAEKKLPTVQEHLKIATELNAKLAKTSAK